MPSYLLYGRKQPAVLWAYAGQSASDEVEVAAPEQINVRWEWGESTMKDASGQPIAVQAKAIVDREIAPRSALWQGKLTEWYGTGSGDTDASVMEVVAYNESPEVDKPRLTRKEVGLAFYKNIQPALSGS